MKEARGHQRGRAPPSARPMAVSLEVYALSDLEHAEVMEVAERSSAIGNLIFGASDDGTWMTFEEIR